MVADKTKKSGMSQLPGIIFPKQVDSEGSDPNNFFCQSCELCFSCEIDFLNHIEPEIVHEASEFGELKSRICKECKKLFPTHRAMRQHFGKTHSKPKKIKCKICNRKFKNSYAVKYHKRQVHEKTTLVKCENCEKTLYNKFRLKEHLKTCFKSSEQVSISVDRT